MASVVGRLKTRSEYQRVAAGRHKWAAPGVVVQARRRAPEPAGRRRTPVPAEMVRYGLTASRKVGSAVVRNRARRRLRAAATEVMAEMGQSGHDYVLIARGTTATRPYALLLEDLRTALRRLSKPRPAGKRPQAGRSEAKGGRGARS